MIRIALLLALGGLMHATMSFTVGTVPGSFGTTVSFGYLLLTAYFAGALFKRVRLPKLTGYLVAGLVVGPSALAFVPEAALNNLAIFTGVAVALIALSAGSELDLRTMRPLFRSIGWITTLTMAGTTLLLAAAIMALRPWLDFLQKARLAQAIAVAFVLGVVMVAKSPAVVVALGKETRADGPVAKTVLGAVVIGDLLVIVLFAVASALAKAAFGAAAATTARMLAWEVLGSFVAGVCLGGLITVYLQKVRDGAGLFVLTTCFVVSEVGRRLYFDPMLVALSAGLFIRNVTGTADRLRAEIDSSSLPVYVTFFAVAGATIHVDALASSGVPAIALVVVRGAGLLALSRAGAKLAGAPEVVQRFAGFGLLPQAGLALALAMLFAKTFPEFGADAAALLLGVVAINELAAPALYRYALTRCGEAEQPTDSLNPGATPTPTPAPPRPVAMG